MKYVTLFVAAAFLVGCGDGSEADDMGLAAECTTSDDCNQDTDPPLVCLTGFNGGYCGLSDCQGNDDCPDDSTCVTHDDSENYCFRTCVEKTDCNANRSADNEANCSSNITRTDGGNDKACVPPGG